MLRALTLILLVANALFFGWSQGWLDAVTGLRASGDREPERLSRAVHPERMKLLNARDAGALQQRSCIEIGPLTGDEALRAAQAALAGMGVAAGELKVQSSESGGEWVVATIKLGSKDFQARKEETYKRLKLPFEDLAGPADELPSLVLSRHPSEKAAQAALDAFEQRNLRGLRLLQTQAPQPRHLLQLPRADATLQARLQAPAEAALAPGFRACADGSRAEAAAKAGAASAAPAASAPSTASAP